MQMEIDQVAGITNKVDLSIDGTSNSLDIDQWGSNNEVSWVDYWGSGASWGGDLDGNNNSLHFYQYCSRGTNCAKSDVGFHVWGNDNEVRWGQGGMLSDKMILPLEMTEMKAADQNSILIFMETTTKLQEYKETEVQMYGVLILLLFIFMQMRMKSG